MIVGGLGGLSNEVGGGSGLGSGLKERAFGVGEKVGEAGLYSVGVRVRERKGI